MVEYIIIAILLLIILCGIRVNIEYRSEGKKWCIIHQDGTKTKPMYYDVACRYKELFGGELVEIKDNVKESENE